MATFSFLFLTFRFSLITFRAFFFLFFTLFRTFALANYNSNKIYTSYD